ncbi:hypothetical protein [Methylophaga muralis]|uniref:Uncharacterized protein n=1 Tax=Methylophaga muralis TaxID=291169 RepID=A0A1E3GTK0_9GAMM|nr:hypothetical protein [Methylophaga muralis]ODN67255.1 hypothetical protein A9E74_00982 [Methylophaga muralis]
MSIDSDLLVLQHHLNKKLEVDASLVITLQQSILQEKALVIWPWLIESSIWQKIPTRVDRAELTRQRPLQSKIHLLILSNDLNLLFRARTLLHEEQVLPIDDARQLRIGFNPLTTEQTCSIFLASGVPMQASLSLILESIVFATEPETAPHIELPIESVTY